KPKNEPPPTFRKWAFPLWYILLSLLVVWFWQDAYQQMAMRNIPYSEFREHLKKGEVEECAISKEEIQGVIVPKAPEGQDADQPAPAKFTFRTDRVDSPELVKELETNQVKKFKGIQPKFITELLWTWVVPMVLIFLFGSFLLRR